KGGGNKRASPARGEGEKSASLEVRRMASPPLDSSELDALAERLADEMRQRWRRGDRPLTEEFLDRHPDLRDKPGAAAELIYEEVCLREEFGEAAASS